MTQSQARANAKPTPAADPLTAATKIMFELAMRRATPPNCKRINLQASVVPPPNVSGQRFHENVSRSFGDVLQSKMLDHFQ